MTKTKARQTDAIYYQTRRAQRKTDHGKVLSFISYSALSASQESKANGRESGRLLFLFHVFRCFTGAKQITRKKFLLRQEGVVFAWSSSSPYHPQFFLYDPIEIPAQETKSLC